MKIVVISDTHNEHHMMDQIGSGDILIHCGDANTKGNYTEGLNFLWWFVKQPFKYKIIVPGNHDKKLKEHPELQSLCKDLGIIMLKNDSITIEGVKFHGACFVPRVNKKSTKTHTLVERNEGWKSIPTKDVDILITHAPPYAVLDMNRRGQHCGCDVLFNKVKDLKPKYHLFGHIHENANQKVYAFGTTFINCCNMNEDYRLIHPHQEIELD